MEVRDICVLKPHITAALRGHQQGQKHLDGDQDLQETLLDTSKTWLKEVAGDNTYNS